ncbi:MAG: glycoside hydrolase family 43 protein [Flavobacteriaceae bacterium]
MPEDAIDHIDFDDLNQRAISQPLVKHIYTADPSAHVFNGKIYIYPSHDVDAGEAFDDLGSHFAMEDYHVISMEDVDSEAIDHGVALHVDEVPWAEKQMWAPDAAHKNGKYYLYFPAKIDPAVFEDEDGSYYMYFGGIWGGQLQRWRTGVFNAEQPESPTAHIPTDDEPALLPFVAKMTDDLLEFAEKPKEVQILDDNGDLLLAGDRERRFFEAAWLHKHNGKYYFSYSTGDTHFICYAIGDNPYGPFTYGGRILNPVVGWTTHHSICKVGEKWYLFYHDSSLSEGVTHLRSVKVTEITYHDDGSIVTLDPYRE